MSSDGPGPVVVIGAGPAGIAAATWLTCREIPMAWYDAAQAPGGTLLRVGNPIDDLPGVRSNDGPAAAQRLLAHAAELGQTPESGVRVTLGDDRPLGLRCHRGDASWSVEASAVIVCAGTRPRLLGLEGEAAHLGRGVEISVTRNLERYAGREVAIVGGGDAALEGALLLASRCPRVHLIHRRAQWRGQLRFVERVLADVTIVRHQPREVVELVGDDAVRGVVLDDGSHLEVAGLFIRIGVEAAVPGALLDARRDDAGYLVVDRAGETSVEGVFAAGDIVGDLHQSVAWALGTGTRAAAAAAARYDALRGRTPSAR